MHPATKEGSGSFPLGQTLITPAALEALSSREVLQGLERHAAGDWGDLDPEDARANARALRVGGRLFSAYQSPDGTKFWIITEADRSATTILLPQDY